MSDFREFWKNPNRKDGLTICRASLHTTIVELEYIAELMLQWVESEDVITVESFYNSKNVPEGTFEDWLKRCPALKEAHDICVIRIGERRERRGLEGKYNASLVSSTARLYNKKLRALWQEDRKSHDDARQTIVVVRDKMPDTSEVMPKHVEMAE